MMGNGWRLGRIGAKDFSPLRDGDGGVGANDYSPGRDVCHDV